MKITKKSAWIITIVYSLICVLFGGAIAFCATYFSMKDNKQNACVYAESELVELDTTYVFRGFPLEHLGFNSENFAQYGFVATCGSYSITASSVYIRYSDSGSQYNNSTLDFIFGDFRFGYNDVFYFLTTYNNYLPVSSVLYYVPSTATTYTDGVNLTSSVSDFNIVFSKLRSSSVAHFSEIFLSYFEEYNPLQPLDAPVILQDLDFRLGSPHNVFTWSAISGADKYLVERVVDDVVVDSEYVTTTSYTIDDFGNYRVMAVNSSSSLVSPYSNVISIPSVDFYAPLAEEMFGPSIQFNYETRHLIVYMTAFGLDYDLQDSYDGVSFDTIATKTVDNTNYIVFDLELLDGTIYFRFRTDTAYDFMASYVSPVLYVSTQTLNAPLIRYNAVSNVISWNSVDNASFYAVYRKVDNNFVFLENVYTNSYSPLLTGDYAVISKSDLPNFYDSDFSNTITVNDVLLTTPSITIFNHRIIFELVPGADYYEIYYSVDNNTFNIVDTFVGNSYFVNNNGYYKIIAKSYNYFYIESGFSNTVNYTSSVGDNTFLGLIGAVIDVPVGMFTSFFNFDILGFNLLSLFTALISLCVIIFIIKFVLSRR